MQVYAGKAFERWRLREERLFKTDAALALVLLKVFTELEPIVKHLLTNSQFGIHCLSLSSCTQLELLVCKFIVS